LSARKSKTTESKKETDAKLRTELDSDWIRLTTENKPLPSLLVMILYNSCLLVSQISSRTEHDESILAQNWVVFFPTALPSLSLIGRFRSCLLFR
jgi:hypothetical protein